MARNQLTDNKMLNLHLAFLSPFMCAVGITHSLMGEVKQYEQGSRIKHHRCIFLYNEADYIMATERTGWLVSNLTTVPKYIKTTDKLPVLILPGSMGSI